MAPAKKDAEKAKEAKLTPEQSADLILQYLRKQNRPYSATDISANLKNRVTKAASAKLLKDMHERKEIEGRAAGKQIVYHVFQDEAEEPCTEDLQGMANETSRLRDEVTNLKAEEKILRTTLRQDTARTPLSELRSSVNAMRRDQEERKERLEKLNSGCLKPISIEKRQEALTDHKRWAKVAFARNKIRSDLWTQLIEVVGKEKEAELREELDLKLR